MTDPATVLIVGDDPNTCETIGDILALQGFEIEIALGGRAALDRLVSRSIDAAIVDVRLPDVSGLDLLAKIKASSPPTEVIVITGHASLPTAIQALDGAAFAYLQRPVATRATRCRPSGGTMTVETGLVDLDEAYARGHAGVEPGPYVLLSVMDTATTSR